jgi:2-hydroxymuconate-semialdehyde hydrolase
VVHFAAAIYTIGNWRTVLEPLAENYHVFAMDLIGFGFSGRLTEPPFFDVSRWLRQAQAMLDEIRVPELGVVGHSLSGALALKLAAADQRVTRVLTTGTAGAPFELNAASRRVWTFPRDKEDFLETAKILIHDHRHISEAYIAARVKTLFGDPDYRAYFTEMFNSDHEALMAQSFLSEAELEAIKIPVTMLHGRNDHPVPASVTLQIAGSLPQANVILIGNCSHSVALEHPERLLSACRLLF